MVDIPVDVGKEPPIMGIITKTQLYLMIPGILLALLLLFAIPVRGAMKIYLVAAVGFIWIIGSLYKVDEQPLLLYLGDVLKFNMAVKEYKKEQIFFQLFNITNISDNRIRIKGNNYVSLLVFTFPSVALKTTDEFTSFRALQAEMLNSIGFPVYFRRTPMLYDPYSYTQTFIGKNTKTSENTPIQDSITSFCTAYENELLTTPRRIPQFYVMIPVHIPDQATKNELKKLRSTKTSSEEKNQIKQNIQVRTNEKINDIIGEREETVINTIISMDSQIQTIIPNREETIKNIQYALTPEAL